MRSVLVDEIRPAMARYRDYLAAEYAARTTVGVATIPDGTACYQASVRFHTSLPISAQEIHDNGLREMERIETEMLEITTHGSGDVNARRLRAVDAIVRVHGSGDADVYAEIDFDGAVYGSGDIDVYGDPENLDRHVSGSGDISRR